MDTLLPELTQKVAGDFLTDREAVALGQTGQTNLRHLLGSHYRRKARVAYQIIADANARCARLCEMRTGYSHHNEMKEDRTIARSQSLPFNTKVKEGDSVSVPQQPADVNDGVISSRTSPILLAFTRIETTEATIRSATYRIGSAVDIRLARSYYPRTPLTEISTKPADSPADSDDEEQELMIYNYENDDGRRGRPELGDFDFLPSTVRQLEISRTILLSPQGTMSTLHRVESLTLGALWPWQLTPTAGAPYWPPQLKRLKFKRFFQVSEDEQDKGQSFGAIDISAITFPSTLTELELPQFPYNLDEDQLEQLRQIQYPQELTKLTRPFMPQQLANWRLPDTLTYLYCEFNPNVPLIDIDQWRLPSDLRTLIFTERQFGFKHNLSAVRLPPRLTSLTLPYWFNRSIESMILPASLIEFHYSRACTLPLDWSHTAITSFTLHLPQAPHHQPLTAFKLPETVTRIDLNHTGSLPLIPASYVWPPQLTEICLTTNFPEDEMLDIAPAPPRLHLPQTLQRLFVRSNVLIVSLNQLKFPDAPIESLTLEARGPMPQPSLAEFILPSKEFILHGSQIQLPQLVNTHLIRLELLGQWNSPITEELPDTLSALRFGDWFDQPLDQLRLPAGLTELRFGIAFDQSLAPIAAHMPQQLRVLALGNVGYRYLSFTHLSSLMSLPLPVSIQEMTIPSPTAVPIVSSSLHPRYTDFVSRLKERVALVMLMDSQQPTNRFI